MDLRAAFLALALSSHCYALVSSDGHTGRLPAMGWNSWNEYECNINETVFVTTGELLISLGLKDLGYNYVNIDDCWSNKENQRDNATGKIQPDYKKFPQGIKHTAEEIHKLGLKLGIYSDAGSLTCAGYAGSLGHEVLDANTWAEWGIDYLKYDNCNVPAGWINEYRWYPGNWQGGPEPENQPAPAPAGYDWTTSKTFQRYKAMSDALLAVNHTIEYSQCAWGEDHIDQWGNATGHSWRMWGDISPSWSSITPILNHAAFFFNTSDFWGHGDWDMLEVGNGDLTIEENRSHFALWAALKSPLLIGTPLDGIKPEVLGILSNSDLISFNQDPIHGAPAKPYTDFVWNRTHPAEYWSGTSSSGTFVFVLNTLEDAQNKTVVFADVPGLDATTEYALYDSWSSKELGNFKTKYEAVVGRHDTMVLRIVKASGTFFDGSPEL